MGVIYFVRHARSAKDNAVDALRSLSEEGRKDAHRVTAFFQTIRIDAMYSSPYKRAVDTIAETAEEHHLCIEPTEAFRERRIGTETEPFDDFARKQWEDFHYRNEDGECLQEVQERTVKGVLRILETHPTDTVIIGTHGTALSTIVHAFDSLFGYADYDRIKDVQPWIVKMVFDRKKRCTEMTMYDFEKEKKDL